MNCPKCHALNIPKTETISTVDTMVGIPAIIAFSSPYYRPTQYFFPVETHIHVMNHCHLTSKYDKFAQRWHNIVPICHAC